MTGVLMEKIHVKRQRHIQRGDDVKTYKDVIHNPEDASGYRELGEGHGQLFSHSSQKEAALEHPDLRLPTS